MRITAAGLSRLPDVAVYVGRAVDQACLKSRLERGNAGRAFLAVLLGSGVAGLAYWRRALTPDGTIAAAIVGGVVYFRGGLPAAASLLAFFGSSSALSSLGHTRKASSTLAQAKDARRDAWQVAANGGVATACILAGRNTAFVGSLAAAAADTWATELGLLASCQPRLITTWKPVAAGTSGGVTPEGLVASVGGALAVGLAWSLAGGASAGARRALVAGASGSLLDSLLGATVQAVYRCPACGAATEASSHSSCGQRTELVRGYAWVTNDIVNAFATLAGAIVGGLLPKTPNAAGHVRGGG